MRIGYDTLVENPLRPSSALEFLRLLLGAMARRAPGHEIVVFVSPKNRALFEDRPPNVRLLECPVSNERIALRILVQQLYYPVLARRHGLEVIFALNQVPLAAPCPTVVKTCTLHHHVMPQAFRDGGGRLRAWYRRGMFDAAARRARLVVANSEATRRAIVERMGVAPEKVRVVYEAVDERFGTLGAEQARRAVAGRFGQQRPYVLYVSNLWPYKNPDGAIGAFARLRQEYGDDLDLLLAGPDDYGRIPSLRELAERRGAGERVKFLGRVAVEDLVALYAAARVIFYPSLAETFGKPVVEAMRSGVPVVAARATCLPEIVGEAGLLADPTDEEEMAAALHRAVTDEEVRRELIARGRERARRFSWEACAEGTWRACAEAAGLRW